MNKAAFQIPGSVSASHPGSDIWTYLANHWSQSKNKEVLLSLLLQLKDSCKINADGFFFFVTGHSTVKLKRLKRGTAFSLGNPGIGGLPKLQGQNVMTPLPFATAQKTPLWHFILPWQTTAMKNSQVHYRICPYAWYFVSDISVTLQRT